MRKIKFIIMTTIKSEDEDTMLRLISYSEFGMVEANKTLT